MSEKPWWRDPRALPPSMVRQMVVPFTPGRVKALRALLVISVLAGVFAIASGHILSRLMLATTVAFQSLLWSPVQWRQVSTRRS